LAAPRWMAAPRLAHSARRPGCVELRLVRLLEGSPRGDERAHRSGPARGTALRPCTRCRHASASQKRARRVRWHGHSSTRFAGKSSIHELGARVTRAGVSVPPPPLD
jgi:hypothetical protein